MHTYLEVLCLVTQSCLTLCDPTDFSPLGSWRSPRGFSRQDNWNGLSCPPPGNLPNPGFEPRYLALQVVSLPAKLPGKPMHTYIHFWSCPPVIMSCILLINQISDALIAVSCKLLWHPNPICQSVVLLD